MTTRKGAIRREKERVILSAAEEIFARFGFKGATTARIAELAGVPKASLHYYFPTKESLYRRVLEDICEAWMDAAAAFDEHDDPREALPTYIKAKMELSRIRPNGSKVWANEIIHGAPILRDYLRCTLKPWFDRHVARIEAWVARGDIEPVDPHALLFMIWATTQHYADFSQQIHVLSGPNSLTQPHLEATGQQLANIILRGVGAKERTAPTSSWGNAEPRRQRSNQRDRRT